MLTKVSSIFLYANALPLFLFFYLTNQLTSCGQLLLFSAIWEEPVPIIQQSTTLSFMSISVYQTSAHSKKLAIYHFQRVITFQLYQIFLFSLLNAGLFSLTKGHLGWLYTKWNTKCVHTKGHSATLPNVTCLLLCCLRGQPSSESKMFLFFNQFWWNYAHLLSFSCWFQILLCISSRKLFHELVKINEKSHYCFKPQLW